VLKTINDKSRLLELYSTPKRASLEKTQYTLDEHSRRFIAASPFLILGTHGDVSPRGDNPGFVKVLDNNTIIIPDRNGNNRLDSMSNIIADPTVALIFLIPGISETFRIRGEAEISTDLTLLEPLAVNKKIPNSGLIIHIREAYIHCAKAIVRSNLWVQEAKQDPLEFAAANIFAAHINRKPSEYTSSYNDDIKIAMAEEGRGSEK
jgi:PPOX class probable FMN-dependent enzyme